MARRGFLRTQRQRRRIAAPRPWIDFLANRLSLFLLVCALLAVEPAMPVRGQSSAIILVPASQDADVFSVNPDENDGIREELTVYGLQGEQSSVFLSFDLTPYALGTEDLNQCSTRDQRDGRLRDSTIDSAAVRQLG